MGKRRSAEQQSPLAKLLRAIYDNQRTRRIAFRYATRKYALK